MKDNWIINKLKLIVTIGLILLINIMFTSCSMLRNYTPSDGVIYSGGTMTIISSNGHQIIIKK